MKIFDLLFDPHDAAIAVARTGDTRHEAGLALLLNADVSTYVQLGERAGWPAAGQLPEDGASTEEMLLAAVALHLVNNPAASNVYEELNTSLDGSARVAVSVLQALAAAQAGDGERAISTLEGELAASPGGPPRMLVQLQLALQLTMVGDTARAIRLSAEANEAPPSTPRRQYSALKAIAAHNLYALNYLEGHWESPIDLPLRGSHPTLVRPTLRASAGLTKFLTDQFDQSTANPYSRTFSFRSVDPIEQPLWAAAFRAECLADLGELREARRLLGRYYVMANLRSDNGVPRDAFTLLRKAWDSKALESAARSVAAVGPLGSLAEECEVVAREPWSPGEIQAVLVLLASGSDLVSDETATSLLERLIESEEFFLRYPSESLRALARLLTRAPPREQTRASRFLRKLVRDHPHPLLIQDARRVVDAADWDGVTSSEVRAWLQYAREHIEQPADERLLAETVVEALAAAGSRSARDLLETVLGAEPSLARVAHLLDAGMRMSTGMRRTAADLAAGSLDKMRSDAEAGTHGLGGGVDVGLVLLALIRGRPRDRHWDRLADFLVEPRVAAGDKTMVLAELARNPSAMPPRLRRRLKEAVPSLAAYETELGGSIRSFETARLHLAFALGALPDGELLQQLSKLATASDVESRRSAAGLLAMAASQIGREVGLMVGLLLVNDTDVSVAAQAARQLAQLPRSGVSVGDVVVDRVEALLGDRGSDIPYWTLAGMDEASRAGRDIPQPWLDAAHRLLGTHPSHRVRTLARTVLGSSRGES